jgi:hypothetical protein
MFCLDALHTIIPSIQHTHWAAITTVIHCLHAVFLTYIRKATSATTYNVLLVCDIIQRISPFHLKRRKRGQVYIQKVKIRNPALSTHIRIQLSSLVYIHNKWITVPENTANPRHPPRLRSWKTTRLPNCGRRRKPQPLSNSRKHTQVAC